MHSQVIALHCPSCGAPVSSGQSDCMYCGQPILVTTFTSVQEMPLPLVNRYASAYRSTLQEHPGHGQLHKAAALCFLRLQLHEQALAAFEQAMRCGFDDPETYLYAAVCLLKGRKAFLTPRREVEAAIGYLNAANLIEPRGITWYFLAYLRYDYFERKYLNTRPDYRECLRQARAYGVSPADIQALFSLLNVPAPTF